MIDRHPRRAGDISRPGPARKPRPPRGPPAPAGALAPKGSSWKCLPAPAPRCTGPCICMRDLEPEACCCFAFARRCLAAALSGSWYHRRARAFWLRARARKCAHLRQFPFGRCTRAPGKGKLKFNLVDTRKRQVQLSWRQRCALARTCTHPLRLNTRSRRRAYAQMCALF